MMDSNPPPTSASELRKLISIHEAILAHMKEELARMEAKEEAERKSQGHNDDGQSANMATGEWRWPLSAEEYHRYGRQLVLPHVGIQGVFLLFFLLFTKVTSSCLLCTQSLTNCFIDPPDSGS